MSVTDVSPIHICQTENTQGLCLFDAGDKLKAGGQYDIGGTYDNDESDLWFYYHTSICPGHKYLLNLFVCHRKPGILSIGVSDGNELTCKDDVAGIPCSQLPEVMTWKILRAVQANENNFIKTYCLTETAVNSLKSNSLYIPIKISKDPKHLVMEDVVNMVKLKHDFGELLFNRNKTDFIIKTPSGQEHSIHKIVLAAHSPVLRSMLKTLKENSLFIDISDHDLDLLLQFLYTGTIKDLGKQNCLQLLEIADKFQLKNLFRLTQYAISKQVTIDNAVDIALLSEKYKLEDMQKNIFIYIKKHPKVLQTEGWKKLNDVNLAKKLLEDIYMERHKI